MKAQKHVFFTRVIYNSPGLQRAACVYFMVIINSLENYNQLTAYYKLLIMCINPQRSVLFWFIILLWNNPNSILIHLNMCKKYPHIQINRYIAKLLLTNIHKKFGSGEFIKKFHKFEEDNTHKQITTHVLYVLMYFSENCMDTTKD